jgi:hypothetical protein
MMSRTSSRNAHAAAFAAPDMVGSVGLFLFRTIARLSFLALATNADSRNCTSVLPILWIRSTKYTPQSQPSLLAT